MTSPYPFAAGATLTAADLNSYAGLVFVKSVTIGSAVSSVTVTDAFSSSFDNYVVKMDGSVSSSIASLRVQVGGVTSGYYGAMDDTNYTGTATQSLTNNGSDLTIGLINTVKGQNALTLNIYGPYLSGQKTAFDSIGHGADRSFRSGGHVDSTASHTSLTIIPKFVTMTGGTIRVYGYNDG